MATRGVKARAAQVSGDRLLAAAVDVIRAKGYSATRVEDICAAASLTKGAFFHHFASKEASPSPPRPISRRAPTPCSTPRPIAPCPIRPPGRPATSTSAKPSSRPSCRSSPACSARWSKRPTRPTPRSARPATATSASTPTGWSPTSPPPRRSTRPPAAWRPESLALFTQATLQGAFVLAKAKHGPEIAVECLDHLRRYVEGLLQAPPDRANRRERRAMTTQQRITPCLWFNFNAEEAVAHYCAIFAGRADREDRPLRPGPARPRRARLMTVQFVLDGMRVRRPQRRAGIHFHAGDFVRGQLPDAEKRVDRLLV